MKLISPFSILTLALLLTAGACNNTGRQTATETDAEEATAANVPSFNADSAYRYVNEQVDFGPRVPGTDAHKACGDYLATQLQRFGATVVSQQANVAGYDGTMLPIRNIIGSYKPEAKKRIALFAHWDSRPWADHDPDPNNRRKPVPGANDGASGTGVLLEIARQIQLSQPTLGIDIILLDAEDRGAHEEYEGEHREEYWCLGSQYWARNPHVQGYNARFGILLDMVGGRDAVFRYEWVSEEHAKNINRKVWRAAQTAGYADYFVPEAGGAVTDDHLFINRYARIPTIDIIPYSETDGFFAHWHTLKDDMDAIDRRTLKAVGQTVMQVIYSEK